MGTFPAGTLFFFAVYKKKYKRVSPQGTSPNYIDQDILPLEKEK